MAEDTNISTEQDDSTVQPQNTGDKDAVSGTGPAPRKDTAFTYKEDRGKWIPPHRLTEESRKRTELETKYKTLETQHAELDRRLKGALGVATQTPQETEAESIRQALFQLVPQLGRLTPEKMEQMEAMLERMGTFETIEQRVWGERGRAARTVLFETIEEAIGGDLSERQQGKILRALRAHIESDPELIARYEAGDDSVIEEYAKEWVEDFVKPQHRAELKTQVDRIRKVPNGRDRGVTPPRQKKAVNVNDPKAFGDALVESFRDHGGAFRDGRE